VVTDAAVHRGTRRVDEVHRLGEFATYRDAEQMVDRLSGAGFPVERVRIVGVGLHSVEQVTGRVTGRRAGLLGAALGAWLGMLAGLLLALFLPAVAWLPMLAGGLLVGAAGGAGIGLLTYSSTDGRSDVAGTTRVRAQRYAVEVARDHAAEAVPALERG